MGSPAKPSGAGSLGRGGTVERVSFRPSGAETRDVELATTTSRINAGVAGGASGRSHLPALRPQARFGGQPPAVRAALRPEMCGSLQGFAVYQKWGQNPACAITSAVTIPERLLPQEENRGHTRFRPGLIGRKEKTACSSHRAVGISRPLSGQATGEGKT